MFCAALCSRAYDFAASLLPTLFSDSRLSKEEQWFWNMLGPCCKDDHHADAVALRAQLLLVGVDCGETAPEGFETVADFKAYTSKWHAVSTQCRLSREDDRRIAKRVVGNFILRKWFGRSAVLQRATLSGRRASLERGSVSPPSRRGSVRGRLRASSQHEASVASTVGRALRRLGSQTSTAGERTRLVVEEGADVV